MSPRHSIRASLALGLLLGCDPAPEQPAPYEPELFPMIGVPAGVFIRGCRPARMAELGLECEADPKIWPVRDVPAREIYMSSFAIDRFEVTIGDYRACIDAYVCRDLYEPPPPEATPEEVLRLPVTGVTFEDAQTFCDWAGKRLPTEAEWEMAARGKDERILPWGNDVTACGMANAIVGGLDCGERPRGPAVVDRFPADVSPYGVRGMAGNVREWVTDWQVEHYYSTSPSSDPTGPGVPNVPEPQRGVRGGDDESVLPEMNLVRRRGLAPDARDAHVGFRCAL